MIRDHGVFAGNAKCRAEVVPGPQLQSGGQLPLLDEEQGGPPKPTRPSRHPWAWLLARVFRGGHHRVRPVRWATAPRGGRQRAGADREGVAWARRARPAAATPRSARARLRGLNDAVGVELRPQGQSGTRARCAWCVGARLGGCRKGSSTRRAVGLGLVPLGRARGALRDTLAPCGRWLVSPLRRSQAPLGRACGALRGTLAPCGRWLVLQPSDVLGAASFDLPLPDTNWRDCVSKNKSSPASSWSYSNAAVD